MGQITVEHDAGGIAGLCVITPMMHTDARGYFMETYNQREMEEEGLVFSFVQDNQSLSVKGVLRGLHYQIHHPQAKLVRVVHGTVFDVAVDLRKDSATFGKAHGVILSSDNEKQYLIPKGFAHGFLVLSDTAEFCYKCDDYYNADDEGGIFWNDPDLNIPWPYLMLDEAGDWYLDDGSPLILSERDRKLKPFREVFP